MSGHASVPSDFAERVYAGVLGKIIGVYLGRPFEQWSHERIAAELGEIRGYVHEKLGVPLIVSDDDSRMSNMVHSAEETVDASAGQPSRSRVGQSVGTDMRFDRNVRSQSFCSSITRASEQSNDEPRPTVLQTALA